MVLVSAVLRLSTRALLSHVHDTLLTKDISATAWSSRPLRSSSSPSSAPCSAAATTSSSAAPRTRTPRSEARSRAPSSSPSSSMSYVALFYHASKTPRRTCHGFLGRSREQHKCRPTELGRAIPANTNDHKGILDLLRFPGHAPCEGVEARRDRPMSSAAESGKRVTSNRKSTSSCICGVFLEVVSGASFRGVEYHKCGIDNDQGHIAVPCRCGEQRPPTDSKPKPAPRRVRRTEFADIHMRSAWFIVVGNGTRLEPAFEFGRHQAPLSFGSRVMYKYQESSVIFAPSINLHISSRSQHGYMYPFELMRTICIGR